MARNVSSSVFAALYAGMTITPFSFVDVAEAPLSAAVSLMVDRTFYRVPPPRKEGVLVSLAMALHSLLDRRLVVLSGKGGVGKSVVGLALALAARNEGKRVLLVEVAAPLEAARYLGRPPSGPREREVLPGLHTVNLDPARVMDEYVRQTVKIDLLSRRILESPIYSRFFAAAPGLKDLMLLGKILVLEEAREGLARRPRYDLIVVDAPATGHGLSLLKVPLAASEAVPIGPVGHNARRILRLLRDRDRTALAIV